MRPSSLPRPRPSWAIWRRQFAQGDFRPLRDWLREKIHRHGQRWSAAELVERVTGRPLSAKPLVEHLRAKLAPLYGL